MGLQLNLIQHCIDHVTKQPYVIEDAEGKLYFDMLKVKGCAKACAYEISLFLVFLMTQSHDFYFPLKEEIIRCLCESTKDDEFCEPEEGYEVLDDGTL